jgi:hypothetical protein
MAISELDRRRSVVPDNKSDNIVWINSRKFITIGVTKRKKIKVWELNKCYKTVTIIVTEK